MADVKTLFAARVPRYTSYPTAPHFHAGVGESTYRDWLAALPADDAISLYIHIPFCDTLCWFCGCHTTVVNSYAPVTGYLDLLARELSLVADALGPKRRVTHLHFGGGSPTLVKPDDLRRLNVSLRRRFDIAADAEIAVEIDPRGFTAEMAEAWADIGVTRASIGVQDCDPKVQRAINRIQPDDVTLACVRMLRAAGIEKLNIDLIYGLPHQTVEGLAHTIETALTLDPDRLAIFGYAHVPHFKKHMALIPEDALPGVAERFAQAEMAQALLESCGYRAIGIDHFAKPEDALAIAQDNGTLRRNFQGYTTDDAATLIGLGASAIGALPQGYVQNISDVPGYRKALDEGRLPVARGVAVSDEDRVRRAAIERLMCDLSVDLAQVAGCFGKSMKLFAGTLAALEPWHRDGVVRIEGSRVTVAPQWRAATRLVCSLFDTYLDEGARRHALAV
ncbi:MAG: oxygen-independent coproporphyrinogen III oxidase [Proteobacteria bacterium]|nr:oxygen-independent coproporphyrinogen III oxidase [Pseudomonadota bacterium]